MVHHYNNFILPSITVFYQFIQLSLWPIFRHWIQHTPIENIVTHVLHNTLDPPPQIHNPPTNRKMLPQLANGNVLYNSVGAWIIEMEWISIARRFERHENKFRHLSGKISFYLFYFYLFLDRGDGKANLVNRICAGGGDQLFDRHLRQGLIPKQESPFNELFSIHCSESLRI